MDKNLAADVETVRGALGERYGLAVEAHEALDRIEDALGEHDKMLSEQGREDAIYEAAGI